MDLKMPILDGVAAIYEIRQSIPKRGLFCLPRLTGTRTSIVGFAPGPNRT